MLQKFVKEEEVHIDTAYVYQGGETENIIGRNLGKLEIKKPLCIATKVNALADSGKKLTKENVHKQFNTSLQRLQVPSVSLLYLHGPDYETPITETLEAINSLYKEGKFKEFGLSNFPAWQVMNIYRICEKNNWLCPSVYQGMYNAVTRSIEIELIPALRELGIRFYAYNPLAGGLLSGKYLNYEEKPIDGRFSLGAMGVRYLNRYWKKNYFEAINQVKSICEKNGITIAEASFRWMSCHSEMKQKYGDGIIFGASKMEHFLDNMKFCANMEPLPKEIVDSFDKAWEIAKPECPSYFWENPKSTSK